ncbi:MAG: alpha/beta hydrolase [Lentisphaerae bacterium]|nr:alpha/beta hydrolase [Lentisphaerota bacterium]
MADNSDTLVVLVHGFCRHGKNMQFWREHLQDDFPNIAVADMPATHRSFRSCLASLSRTVELARPQLYRRICFAGHSMGGLLLREFLAANPLPNADKLVCVGTPHYGSKLADWALLLGFPYSGLIWPPLWALRPAARKRITTPNIPGLTIGALVSTNNAHWPGKVFLSRSADGLVESFSAEAPDADAIAYVEAPHDPMQYDLKTVQLIRQFFLHGNFDLES